MLPLAVALALMWTCAVMCSAQRDMVMPSMTFQCIPFGPASSSLQAGCAALTEYHHLLCL